MEAMKTYEGTVQVTYVHTMRVAASSKTHAAEQLFSLFDHQQATRSMGVHSIKEVPPPTTTWQSLT